MQLDAREAEQSREQRFLNKALGKSSAENTKTLTRLRERPDYLPVYDYFLDLAEEGFTPTQVARRTGREVVNLLCLQAPLELIHAAGLAPFKIFSGSQAAGNLVAQGLPALMCPMLRSALGAARLSQSQGAAAWIFPTTCDWAVKFPEMLKLTGVELDAPSHWLELPHLKDALHSQEMWLSTVYGLKKFLEKITATPITRSQLMNSLKIYQQAWGIFSRLVETRRHNRISAAWFFLITNVFYLDTVEKWTEAVSLLLPLLEKHEHNPSGRVYLAGSPIFFPNFKLLDLLEEAGLSVVADDMCSSERLFPGAVSYSDSSEFGLMSALAQRYHQGCLCPTFADNDRRVNNILSQLPAKFFSGVVFQVLKGCHPFDLESFALEGPLKERGLKYIRLETDYTLEDSQNLLTRLEAYRQTMED